MRAPISFIFEVIEATPSREKSQLGSEINPVEMQDAGRDLHAGAIETCVPEANPKRTAQETKPASVLPIGIQRKIRIDDTTVLSPRTVMGP
jgi:hypothetical protein